MNAEQIEQQCRQQEKSLLDKYFGNIVAEAAKQENNIEGYDTHLPDRVKREYVDFLSQLWVRVAPDDNRSIDDILEEHRLRELLTDNLRGEVGQAHRNAVTETLWERITGTNHRDVTYYKGLLREYTAETLSALRLDFLEEVTGRSIEGKTF